MKLTLNILEKHRRDADRRWPSYMFGGRVRTSTLVLIIAFFLHCGGSTPPTGRTRLQPAGAAGGAAGLRARPQLHLGAAHQGAAAADVRHADHHGPDHDAADHATYDDNAAAADPAACAAAAVRSADRYGARRAPSPAPSARSPAARLPGLPG